jgi:hypothetical protein
MSADVGGPPRGGEGCGTPATVSQSYSDAMAIVIQEVHEPTPNGIRAIVSHNGARLEVEVSGNEHQVQAALGRELTAELGFAESFGWRTIPNGTTESHGLRQISPETIGVTGTVHNIVPVGDGTFIYDIYIQRGPEFLSCRSAELPGSPPRVGDCIEIEVRGLRFYPNWK